jgi:Transposase DDE domain
VISGTKHIFAGMDSTGFKKDNSCFTVLYRKNRIEKRRKYAKLSIGTDVLQQIICNIRIRRAPTRHDNIDFKPIVKRIANILPLSVVTADKGYDSEDNHLLIREYLHAFSVIPARYEHVPIWRTHGRYRK